MALALQIAWYILLVILGVITLILITPVQVRLRGGRETGLGWLLGYVGGPLRILGVGVEITEAAARYRVYWLGIPVWRRPIRFEKHFSSKEKKRAKRRAREEKREKRAGTKKGRGNRDLFDVIYLLQTPNVSRVTGRLFRLLNPTCAIRGQVGFDDPAATGLLAALLGFLQMAAPGIGEELQLNFQEAEIRGALVLGMTIWIPEILVGALVIALGRDGRQLIAHLWGLRRRRPAKVAQP
jgi:hypothetical protein